MADILVEASWRIEASAAEAYMALADYQDSHRSILPEALFREYAVVEGGFGEGTRVRVTTHGAAGRRTFDLDVTEPEPGRRLVETDRLSTTATEFVVEALPDGRSCQVTIRTRCQTPGLRGWLERWLAPRLLRPFYQTELGNLNRLLNDRRLAQSLPRDAPE